MKTHDIVRLALKEDAVRSDVTTRFTVPAAARARADMIAKAEGVVCGLELVREIFTAVDAKTKVETFARDGDRVSPGQVVARITGGARSVLAAERTALNFIQHLSGVATLTARYVTGTEGTKARILDTRKTLPGMRELEKHAVRCGGGENHRMNLSDMVLIKDNHLALSKDLPSVTARIRKAKPGLRIEVECETLEQVRTALEAAADIIMLDNMDLKTIRRAVAVVDRYAAGRKKRPELEISGGVTLKTVRRFAQTGVDRISVGAVTHSAPGLDISLEISL